MHQKVFINQYNKGNILNTNNFFQDSVTKELLLKFDEDRKILKKLIHELKSWIYALKMFLNTSLFFTGNLRSINQCNLK